LVISSNPLVRKDMDLNEHERLSNIICRHKFKPKETNGFDDITNVRNQTNISPYHTISTLPLIQYYYKIVSNISEL
jgi:hypothetical protein